MAKRSMILTVEAGVLRGAPRIVIACSIAFAFSIVMALMAPIPASAEWDDWGDDNELPVEIHGFIEGAIGGRVVEDPAEPNDLLLNEARFRLDLARYMDRAELYFKGDFVADDIERSTYVDIRRAAILLRVASWLDVVTGRQVLTWGTGDLLFLNDRFPKDFVSFFIGRDDEYLKAPSNSMKMTFYSAPVNFDFVWTPTFTPDDYITGERLSFYSPFKPGITGAEEMGGPLEAELPAQTWENGAFAGRLYRTVDGYELAAYGYHGFANQPTAVDTANMTLGFAALGVYGASVRGNLIGGIGNIEGAYYDSIDDRDGTNGEIPNSEIRGLAGYERELRSDFSIGLQYYIEWILKYDALVANALGTNFIPEELNQLLTLRLTRRLMQQTLTLSLFGFYSPNEGDGYVRAAVTRDWSDAVKITAGANVMWGTDNTEFGQLEQNTNVYIRARYGF